MGCKTSSYQVANPTYYFRVISQKTQAHLLFDKASATTLKQITLPNWKGCSESRFRRGAFTDCTRRNLEQYINETLVIPQEALAEKLEGYIEYQFRLNEDGSISDSQINKDIGKGLGAALATCMKESTQFQAATINEQETVATEIQLTVFCDIVLRR